MDLEDLSSGTATLVVDFEAGVVFFLRLRFLVYKIGINMLIYLLGFFSGN